jgi:hypothetical protein
MKHFIDVPTRVFWWVLFFLVTGLVQTGGVQAQARASPTPNARQLSKSKATPSSATHPTPCPHSGISPIRSSSTTGHHKVVLSWNPSTPSSNGHTDTVGYCLYRTKDDTPPKEANCADCEQINPFAFNGVSCLDTVVEDNAKYKYVVAAVDINSHISSPSNWAPASIPVASQPGAGHIPSPPPPECRGASDSWHQRAVH